MGVFRNLLGGIINDLGLCRREDVAEYGTEMVNADKGYDGKDKVNTAAMTSRSSGDV